MPKLWKSILDGVTIGSTGRADAHDLMVSEDDERIHKQVKETAVQAWTTHTHINLHVMDWVAAQEDSILKMVMELISSHKVQDLKHLLGDHTTTGEDMAILREQNKFMLHQGALYHCHPLAGELEEAMQFVVPMVHIVVAMNGCHRDAGHQGQWQMLSLLQHWFWCLAWQCGCRRQSVAVKDVFSMQIPESRLHYKLFWSPPLWSCFMWISLALKKLWNWTNHHM